ncbi:MAG TPA: D-aminoacyl-tRNA deacylase [Spirochaetota bacterium]|nr:D-aminoacyl-tRNA deacylase [Spirochaetota bacterium]
MRAVLQRVSAARVDIGGCMEAEISSGILVFAGFSGDDTDADLDYVADKIAVLRIFGDDEGRMNRSLVDVQGELLVVSQFTLYGDARKGRRPSFTDAMEPGKALVFYEKFVQACRERMPVVRCGVFGADMQVSLVNDGPVTLLVDSSRLF